MEKEFGYISRFHVWDCYASQDFWVPITSEGERFSHLILTGRNGAGKSTVLRGLEEFTRDSPGYVGRSLISKSNAVVDSVESTLPFYWYPVGVKRLQVLFPATRVLKVRQVVTPTPDEPAKVILAKSGLELAPELMQFLVNKKVAQAFSLIGGRKDEVATTDRFFEALEGQFRQLFSEPGLRLNFHERAYDFDFELDNGRKWKFDQLPDGFAASVFLLMDLTMRVEAIRAEAKDFALDPCGIVFIDEPELHMHLGLQYEILPLLTTAFPNIQFIVATHSPAVASSIKNATVFDLTTKQVAPSSTPGASYSSLMQTHFGLENEYGPLADELLDEVRKVLMNGGVPKEKSDKIHAILNKYEDIITPELRVDLESTMIQFQIQAKLKA